MTATDTAVLEMRGIRKAFPGTKALDGVDLTVRAGEVHCLLGENGAGKSTLMKVLAGSYRADSGQIFIEGEAKTFATPSDGIEAGVAVIYQELDLFPDLTVAQNLFMGSAPSRAGLLRSAQRQYQAQVYLNKVGATFDASARVGSLSIADQQLTAIARALTSDAKVIVMDEPTATLGDADVQNVYRVVRSLADEGRAVIFISHRLAEVAAIGDRITVLREGTAVASYAVAEHDAETWIEDMIGKKAPPLHSREGKKNTGRSKPMLEIEHVRIPGLIDVLQLDVYAGEIVGLAGLAGAGRTTLLSSIFGATSSRNRLRVDGHEVTVRSTQQARRLGFGLVPESRKEEGLMLGLSVARNGAMASHDQPPWFFPHSRGRERVLPILKQLGVKFSSPSQIVGQLSGGNQQKIVLSKWLARNTRVLLLDEPTRGLDIGAKADLYEQVQKLAAAGAAVLVASSELAELMANADRIAVLHEGSVVGTYDPLQHSDSEISRAIISGEDTRYDD